MGIVCHGPTKYRDRGGEHEEPRDTDMNAIDINEIVKCVDVHSLFRGREDIGL
jgi:hypothetical protein